LAPVPPNAIFAFGIRAGLDELPITAKLPAAVSASPTVKLRAPVELSSLMFRSAIVEIVGAELEEEGTEYVTWDEGELSNPALLYAVA